MMAGSARQKLGRENFPLRLYFYFLALLSHYWWLVQTSALPVQTHAVYSSHLNSSTLRDLPIKDLLSFVRIPDFKQVWSFVFYKTTSDKPHQSDVAPITHKDPHRNLKNPLTTLLA